MLGNIIDHYIQGMQHGQTNGIPQGSTLSDFIAEMVLAYADKELDNKLNSEGITNFHIVRYRDDYRIFCNSKEETERIVFLLQEVLSELNFQLNVKKTYLTEEIISEAIKPDKKAYVFGVPIYRKSQEKIYSVMSNLQQEALYIHQFSKNYPNSGTLIKLLTIFAQRLISKFAVCGDVRVLISIFADIALSSPKTYKIILAIISKLISKIATTDERERIVNDIYTKFQRFPNIGEIQIWMQHITYRLPHPITYSEKICKIVNDEFDVELWNNDWVKDVYKDAFPQHGLWGKDCDFRAQNVSGKRQDRVHPSAHLCPGTADLTLCQGDGPSYRQEFLRERQEDAEGIHEGLPFFPLWQNSGCAQQFCQHAFQFRFFPAFLRTLRRPSRLRHRGQALRYRQGHARRGEGRKENRHAG